MKPDKIFVSSTSVDLGDYRAALVEALRGRGTQVEDMRDFYARPAEPVAVSVDAVRECDIFVGVYAFRYGYTPEEGGPSVTEMEYRRARADGKRCLIFFADNSLTTLPGSDEGEPKQGRLKSFKEEIEEELVRDYGFKTPDELANRAVLSYDKLAEGYLPGYSRADFRKRWAARAAEYAPTFRQKQELREGLLPSPLLPHWELFNQAVPWHERMRTRVASLCLQAEALGVPSSFANRFAPFDWDRNYLSILEDLQPRITQRDIDEVRRLMRRLENEAAGNTGAGVEKFYELRRLHGALIDARQRVEQPHFQRCFLVRGSLGSGKTHFVATALEAVTGAGADSHPVPLVLLLESHEMRPNEGFEEFLLRQLGKASGLSWMSLEEFERFIQGAYEGASAGGIYRLVIALDDIHEWLPLRGGASGFKKVLEEFVNNSTSLHSVYWLFTVQDTSYAAFAGMREFWGRYSYFNAAQYRGRPELGDGGPAPEVPEVDGWAELNQMNLAADLGVGLICERLRLETDEELATFDLLRKDEVAMQNLSLPFIVWILLGLYEKGYLDIYGLATLSYVSLVEKFWDERGANFAESFWNRYDPSSTLRTGGQSDADEVVRPVARALAGADDLVFTRGALLKLVRAAVGEDDGFDATRFAEPALNAFVETNLMSPLEGFDPADPEVKTTLLKMSFEPFWEYHLARQLKKSEAVRSYDRAAARAELEKWFGNVKRAGVTSGVLEFLLLFLEQGASGPEESPALLKAREFLKFMVDLSFSSDALPNDAAWLAGVKAHTGLQDLIAFTAEGLAPRLVRRTLHAFMYFVNGALPSVMKPSERLCLLQPSYAAMGKESLCGYFFYVAKRLIQSVEDEEELLSCMVYLDGCEVMGGGVAARLARLTRLRLVEFAEAGGESGSDAVAGFAFELVIRYLSASVEAGQDWRNVPSEGKKEPPYHYIALLLSEFCDWLTRELALGAYHFLRGRSWYRPEQLGINDRRTLVDMQREANFALGDWYRRQHPEDRRPYVELVRALADSPRQRDVEIAFYLIRHSEVTGRADTVRVSQDFRPMLEKIFLDPRQDRIVRTRYRMFEVNFDPHHFRRLQEQRNAMLNMHPVDGKHRKRD